MAVERLGADEGRVTAEFRPPTAVRVGWIEQQASAAGLELPGGEDGQQGILQGHHPAFVVLEGPEAPVVRLLRPKHSLVLTPRNAPQAKATLVGSGKARNTRRTSSSLSRKGVSRGSLSLRYNLRVDRGRALIGFTATCPCSTMSEKNVLSTRMSMPTDAGARPLLGFVLGFLGGFPLPWLPSTSLSSTNRRIMAPSTSHGLQWPKNGSRCTRHLQASSRHARWVSSRRLSHSFASSASVGAVFRSGCRPTLPNAASDSRLQSMRFAVASSGAVSNRRRPFSRHAIDHDSPRLRIVPCPKPRRRRLRAMGHLTLLRNLRHPHEPFVLVVRWIQEPDVEAFQRVQLLTRAGRERKGIEHLAGATMIRDAAKDRHALSHVCDRIATKQEVNAA